MALLDAVKLVPGHTWFLIAAIGGMVAYHEASLQIVKYDTEKADTEKFAAQLKAANDQAKADHDALQQKIDTQAPVDNGKLEKNQAAILARLNSLPKIYAPKGALPVNCVFDADRISQANQALAQ